MQTTETDRQNPNENPSDLLPLEDLRALILEGSPLSESGLEALIDRMEFRR